jgi:hypothetical protein
VGRGWVGVGVGCITPCIAFLDSGPFLRIFPWGGGGGGEFFEKGPLCEIIY